MKFLFVLALLGTAVVRMGFIIGCEGDMNPWPHQPEALKNRGCSNLLMQEGFRPLSSRSSVLIQACWMILDIQGVPEVAHHPSFSSFSPRYIISFLTRAQLKSLLS